MTQDLENRSKALAKEWISKLEKERLKVNSGPVDKFVANQTLTMMEQLLLRYMSTNQTQELPNNEVLIPITHEVLSFNKKIFLAFCGALSSVTQKEDLTSFTNLLDDIDVDSFSCLAFLEALQKAANLSCKKYRLFLFSNNNGRIPVFKGDRIASHRFALGVYVKNQFSQHMVEVYAVTNVSRLFHPKNKTFCPDCVACFCKSSAYAHRKTCPLRCPNCCKYGYDYPCADEKKHLLCTDCNRVFNNLQCFKTHQMIACEKVKCCPNCNETYVIRRPKYVHKCLVHVTTNKK